MSDHVGTGHQTQQQSGTADGRHAQAVEYSPWMSVTSVGARDIPVTAKAMAMGMRKAL